MPTVEGKCADPKCAFETSGSKGDKQAIACASPFCKSLFHLQCAGLKVKKVSNLYFLCTACNDFINYTQKPLHDKLANLEEQIKLFTTSMNEKIIKIEEQFKQSQKQSTDKIEYLNTALEGNKIKLNSVESKLRDFEKSFTDKINTFEGKVKELEDKLVKSSIDTQPSKIINVSEERKSPKRSPSLKYQLRLTGFPEIKNENNRTKRQQIEREYVESVLKHMDKEQCKITDCFRLGKFNKDRKSSRSLLVTFASVWDRNMVLQNANLLSTFKDKISLAPALSPADFQIEKKLLHRRWQLIQNGAKKENIKIKNFELLLNGEVVKDDSE